MEALKNILRQKREAVTAFAELVQMYYDGSWEFNSARFNNGQELMEGAVRWLEIEAGVKIDTKEVS